MLKSQLSCAVNPHVGIELAVMGGLYFSAIGTIKPLCKDSYIRGAQLVPIRQCFPCGHNVIINLVSIPPYNIFIG